MKNLMTPEMLQREYRAIHKNPVRTFIVPEAIPPLVTTDADSVAIFERAIELGRSDISFLSIAALARGLQRGETAPARARTVISKERKVVHQVLGTLSFTAERVPSELRYVNRAMGSVKDGMDDQVGNVATRYKRLKLAAGALDLSVWSKLKPASVSTFEDRRHEHEVAAAQIANAVRLPFEAMHQRRRQVRNLAALYSTAALLHDEIEDPVVSTALALQRANNVLGQSLGAQRDAELLQAPTEAQEIIGQYLQARREVSLSSQPQ